LDGDTEKKSLSEFTLGNMGDIEDWPGGRLGRPAMTRTNHENKNCSAFA